MISFIANILRKDDFLNFRLFDSEKYLASIIVLSFLLNFNQVRKKN